MLNIDLTGRRALVAGVADDGGFGFAIAKALAEAGASVCVGTWPPALNIFMNLLERGKMDESRRLSTGELLEFEKIYPLDAVFDTYDEMPEESADEQALQGRRRLLDRRAGAAARGGFRRASRSTSWSTRWRTGPR